MADKVVEILRKSKLFSKFSPKQIDQVMTCLKPKVVTFKKDEYIYKRGEPADCCWLIQSGSMMLKRPGFRTKLRRMVYSEGSVTNIQGLVDVGSKRVVTMIAEDKVKLVKITHKGIADMDIETQAQLWRNVSKLLLRKLAVCLSAEDFND